MTILAARLLKTKLIDPVIDRIVDRVCDRMVQLLDQQALSLSETKRSLHAENIGQERDSRECAPLSDRPSETERLSYAKVIGELPPPEHPPAAPRADDRGFILDIYRGLLGRDPDEVGMHDFSDTLRNGSLDRVGVIKAILSSTEFKSRRIGAVQYQGHESPGCLRSEAEAVFGRFKKHKGSGRPGFVTNFLGGSTDVRFVHGIESLSGVVEGYPIPGNFHGDTLEWVGTLRSALDASSTFTMLELGAGWAPWCVIGYLAAKHRGIQKIKLIGVEGDAGHIKFIRESFAANGIGPDIGKAIHGVVGVADGEADFPKATDASRVYGGAAAFSETDKAGGAFADFSASQSALVEQVDNLPCFSLMTLMRDFDQVDLIHCDIQGAEANLFTQMIEPVSEKVKRIVVGTHSFEIDRRLACVFAKHSWDLEGMNACVMREDSGKPVIVHDGVQVWRNMRF